MTRGEEVNMSKAKIFYILCKHLQSDPSWLWPFHVVSWSLVLTFVFFSQLKLKLVIWLKMVGLQRMTLVECFLINSMQRWRLYLLHLRWSSRGWTTSRKSIQWHWKRHMFHCFGPPKFWKLAEWGWDEINFKNVVRVWLDRKVGDNTTVYQYPPCSTRCSARVQVFSEHEAA